MEGSEKVDMENRIIRCEVDAGDAEAFLRAVFDLDIDVLHIRIRDLNVFLMKDYVLLDNTDFTRMLQIFAKKLCQSAERIKYERTERLLEVVMIYAKYGEEEAIRKIGEMIADMVREMNMIVIEIVNDEKLYRHIFRKKMTYWEEIIIEKYVDKDTDHEQIDIDKYRTNIEFVVQRLISVIRSEYYFEVKKSSDRMKMTIYE